MLKESAGKPVREPASKPVRREIELDFIRGIAILMVVDFHCPVHVLFTPFLWLGFPVFGAAGVGVFFVLSGFLVGGLLVKEWKTRGRIDTRRFLIRRGFKIWPQYYVYLALLLLTRHRTLATTWGNLLNIQNYVGGVAHTWSLAVEEHAYLFLVLLLMFAARARSRMRNLFLLIAALCVAISALRMVLAIRGYNVFLPTHTRIDGILLGVLLAILYHYVPDTFHRIQRPTAAWVAGLLLALGIIRISGTYSPDVYPLLGAVNIDATNLLGVSLIFLLYRHRPDLRRPALYRLVAWIGLYSYGIYLWHVSIIAPTVHLAARLPQRVQPFFEAAAVYALAVLIGYVTTKAIEFPSLRLRDRLFPRRVDSAVGTPAELEPTTLDPAVP